MSIHIKNSKGMCTLATAAAITPDDRKVVFLSIAGVQTAVKAIWASVVSRRSPLWVLGDYRAIRGDGDVDYLVVKQTLAPGIHHWVLYPEPGPTAPYLLLVPLNGMDVEEQLVHLLNQHTLWPVKAEWGKTLWERGYKQGLAQKLVTYGDLSWAYAVSPVGWDEVIDEAAKEGLLTFGNGGEPCHA